MKRHPKMDPLGGNLLRHTELTHRAKTIPKAERKHYIESLPETELHSYLRELFQGMQPDYLVEITHGVDERGKDLVIVKRDTITTDVIGIVVKRGNIMSKTLGDVDQVIDSVNNVFGIGKDRKLREVQSQIRQAFANPAELRAVFNTLPVNKVFVVLAGEISSRGRTRLANEAKGPPVDILDINWLVERFTEFYPQIFFDGKVTDCVQAKIQELETKSWHVKERQNLSDCYVEPLVRNVNLPITLDDARIAAAMITKRLPFSKLRSTIAANQRIVLVGDPGTGKSAALAKLAIEMLNESYLTLTRRKQSDKKVEVPLLQEAKSLLEIQTADDLLGSYFGDPHVVSRVKVRVLMVDALDEVPASQRDSVVERANLFSDELGCALIITSRKLDMLSSTPTGFGKFELLPFEASQALKLFEKIHGKDELLDSLKSELDKIRYQIPMVPLSLILLMELVEESSEVPASITELYERYVDIVLGRFDKKKGIEVLFDYTIKKRFLCTLAYREFLSKSRLEIPQSDYQRFLADYAREYSLEEEFIDRFVKEIERTGVLGVNENEVSFGHRSFLDYFTAFYIYDNRDEIERIDDFLVDRYFDDVWGDTVFFYLGHRKETNDRFVSKLLAHSEGSSVKTHIAQFLLGQLLQAAWHSPSKVKQHGIQEAFALVPELRQEIKDLSDQAQLKGSVPGIFGDFATLILTGHSFRSSFLQKDVKKVFDATLEAGTNLLALSFQLWALKPFIAPSEFKKSAQSVLDAVSSSKQLGAEEKARALLMLKVIERDDKQLLKTIKKKLQIIRNRNPEILKKLLPKPIRGSMPASSKKRNTRVGRLGARVQKLGR